MKAIIIDNNDVAIKLFDKLECTFIRNNLPSQIAKDLRRDGLTISEKAELPQCVRFNNEDVTFFINIEIKTDNALRINQSGIEVLKWLRVKYKISNAIVLYSFLNSHQLLKLQPDNLILCSDGCYFVNLPFNCKNAIRNLLIEEYKGVHNWEELKLILAKSINAQQFRHSYANWWGLKCLRDLHSIANNTDFEEEYEDENNLDKEIFKFVFQDELLTLYKHIKIRKFELETKLQEAIKNKTDTELQQVKIADNIEALNCWIEDINRELASVEENYKYSSSSAESYISQQKDRIELFIDLERFNKDLSVNTDNIIIYSEKINKLTTQLNNSIDFLREELFKNKELPTIRNDIKVLHIDDKINDGWGIIIRNIIYNGANEENYTSIIPEDKFRENIQELYKRHDDKNNLNKKCIKFYITNCNPDLILLDLRLFDEQSNSIDIKQLSGYKLLEEIRNEFAGLPIVITSASNKIWSYKELMNAGADAYWIKEGMDELRNVNNSIDNYIDLLKVISEVTGDKYIELKQLSELIEEIKAIPECDLWWVRKDWNFEYNIFYENKVRNIIPRITEVNKEIVFDILKDSLSQLRLYYQTTVLNNGFNLYSDKEWFISSQIILHLSKVIELIHNFDTIRNNVNKLRKFGEVTRYTRYDESSTIYYEKRGSLIRRNDVYGNHLQKIRNKAAHYAEAITLTIDDMEEFFFNILTYLKNNGPTSLGSLIYRVESNKVVYDSSLMNNPVEDVR